MKKNIIVKKIRDTNETNIMKEESTYINCGEIKFSRWTEQLYCQLDSTKMAPLRCVIKVTEYTPISGGNILELNKIPELFLNKRSLLILKNNDDKCFLYCYIRKFLNPITNNSYRITKKGKELADKIINETNLTFENVSVNEMNKIEKN